MAKKKVVSISLETGEVTAVRYEDISEESRKRLSDMQKVYTNKFYRSMREAILSEERKGTVNV